VNDLGGEAGDVRGDLLVIQGNYNITAWCRQSDSMSRSSHPEGSDTEWGDTAGNLYQYNITTVDANVPAGVKLVVQAGSLATGRGILRSMHLPRPTEPISYSAGATATC